MQSTVPQKRSAQGRFASPVQELAEEVVDFQVALEDIAHEQEAAAAAVTREVREDEADDRRRFVKYQAVEHAIRRGDMATQLVTFHTLVAHVEADELREDARRRGRIPALQALAVRLISLRRIFHADFAPLIMRELES